MKSWSFGKVKVAEKSTLSSAEKRYGVTWAELHSYKDKMAYPTLPRSMPVDAFPTGIDFCDNQFRGLDRCIENGIRHESSGAPYARMHVCKPMWLRFNKCVKRRDDKVADQVLKWEAKHFMRLDAKEKVDYINDIDTKMQFMLYMAGETEDVEKTKLYNNAAQLCARRQLSLQNPEQLSRRQLARSPTAQLDESES